jgi:hypothetical protein
MKPGDLVKVLPGVLSQDRVGVIIKPVSQDSFLMRVMFHDGVRKIHVANLQKIEDQHGVAQ